MLDLGYSKGYVYNPENGYKRGCDEGYLPAQFAGRRFFREEDCEPGYELQRPACPASAGAQAELPSDPHADLAACVRMGAVSR